MIKPVSSQNSLSILSCQSHSSQFGVSVISVSHELFTLASAALPPFSEPVCLEFFETSQSEIIAQNLISTSCPARSAFFSPLPLPHFLISSSLLMGRHCVNLSVLTLMVMTTMLHGGLSQRIPAGERKVKETSLAGSEFEESLMSHLLNSSVLVNASDEVTSLLTSSNQTYTLASSAKPFE